MVHTLQENSDFVWFIFYFYFFYISLVSAVVVPDGTSEKSGVCDDLGSEEDFLYEEFRGSGHRFGHPGGGGGEQLAINEVLV